jgi:integrase
MTFFEMAAAARGDYRTRRLRTLKRLNISIKHLEEFFGAATLAVAITKDRIDGYIGSRRKAGAKDATIHAEVAALSKMFTCAIEAGKLTAAQRPMFPSLGVIRNARKGVFEESQYTAALKELPDDPKPLVEAYYWTGWRKGELLTLRWSQIDFMRGEMRLDGAHTKNGQPRVFPFSELKPLADVLYRQRAQTDRVEKEIKRKVEWVFESRLLPLQPQCGTRTSVTRSARGTCTVLGLVRDAYTDRNGVFWRGDAAWRRDSALPEALCCRVCTFPHRGPA